MSTYVIGDVQGCFASLCALLRRLDYRRDCDRLWFVGDLVNRGPKSLEVLRWIAHETDNVTCVLGNHDVHLLACAAGVTKPRARDTLAELLAAVDRTALIDWLRQRPLLHREGPWVMVHAGLLPAWNIEQALARARRVERLLCGQQWAALIAAWRSSGDKHTLRLAAAGLQQDDLVGLDVFTRLRMVDAAGTPELSYTGPPQLAPAGLQPWFSQWAVGALTVVFGHWAALGLYRAPGFWGIDTGCVWGRSLTALRLEDGALFSQPACELPL